MPSELYRTYEVLVEESVHPDHPKRSKTSKPSGWGDGSTYAALKDTNDIFQDAVCYYTILLAGLAGDLNPLWAEMCQRETQPDNDVTQVLQRFAANYPKLAGATTLAAFCVRVFTSPSTLEAVAKMQQWRQDTYRIIEQQGTEHDEAGLPTKCKDMTQFAASWASILCDPTGETVIPGNGIFDQLHRELLADLTPDGIAKKVNAAIVAAAESHRPDFSLRFNQELVACDTEQKRQKKIERKAIEYRKFLCDRRKNAQANVVAAFKKGLHGKTEKLDISTERLREVNSEFARLALNIEQMKPYNPRFKRLRYGERDNSFEAVILRFLWLRDDAALRDLALQDLKAYLNDPTKKPEQAPSLNGSEVRRMPYAEHAKIVFPLFVTPIADITSATRSAWWEFDASAFATAVEDVFKYKIRSLERSARVAKLRAVQTAFEGDGAELKAEESPTGKPMTIRGMKGDPRWEGEPQTGKKAIADLLEDLRTEKELDDYGLRGGTIGGWADLRKAFLRAEKAASQENLRENLDDAVENEQRENRQGFGDANFFNKLCEPQYHHLWSASAERNSIRDFIPHFVRYCEWIEELGELALRDDNGKITIKPISYTFPGTLNRHKEISYRHFDFKDRLNRQMKLTLFRKSTDGVGIRYDLLEDVPVTLSARRLKRDKVMTADGTSLNAVWCPPLVLEDDKPRAGKRKSGQWPSGDLTVSFSLMVEHERDGEPQPVHLKVAVPIEWGEQKKLRKGTVRWEAGSLKGYAMHADERRHFKWPVDLETGKTFGDGDEERVTAAKLWCGDGKQPLCGFRVKKADGSGSQTISDFHMLSIDLGTRFSSAFSRLRVHCDPNGEGRVISPDSFTAPVRAHVYRKGTLRLQGEDVKRPVAEPYGNDGRGRFPKPEEIEAFKTLAGRIVPEKAFPIIGVDKMTYPELGDHLVMRLRRRVSRIRSLFSLRWHMSGTMERDNSTGKYDKPRRSEDQLEHYRVVVETLGTLAFPKKSRPEGEEEHPDNAKLRDALNSDNEVWKAIKGDLEPRKEQADKTRRCQRLNAAIKDWNWNALSKEVARQLDEYFTGKDATSALLVAIVEHCLPLRKRHWRWHDSEHRLFMERGETDPRHVPLIQGMRGLSIRRLEQVLNLRQRCQSFAKLEKRFADGDGGINPPAPMKRGEGDDPCEDLLDKSNELRDQRVNQAAHMILAEALGLELKSPEEVENKKARKSDVDLHGEYKPILDPKTKQPLSRCSVIALEDLTRYRTSQERTRSENSRLMQWAHRAIVKKLADIAKPFGITIMLVDPAFSSRFHSRTGLPGIRVNSESRGFHEKMPYAAWLTQKNKSNQPSDLAKAGTALKDLFAKHPQYDGQLLIAVEGGKEFLPVPGNAAEQTTASGLMNADENAAINIGLRALAHPDRMDIFSRVRTAEVSEKSVRVSNRRGSFAKLANDDQRKRLTKIGSAAATIDNDSEVNKEDDNEQKTESSQYPDFFINAGNFPGMPEGESHAPHSNAGQTFKAYRRGLFLKRVQQLCGDRIKAINERRLAGR